MLERKTWYGLVVRAQSVYFSKGMTSSICFEEAGVFCDFFFFFKRSRLLCGAWASL